MSRTRRAVLIGASLVATSLVLVPSPAHAADFVPGPGVYTVNTTTLALSGPGTGLVGSDQGGVAVFSFDNVVIQPGVTLQVTGSRPFRLQASGALTLGGVITGSGGSATDFNGTTTPGGPGGYAGGPTSPNRGPGAGGGTAASEVNGAGGGGFGGLGAIGGVMTPPSTGGGRGAAYGDIATGPLTGGSAGGSGSGTTSGGGGGGALEFVAPSVSVLNTGLVSADGGGGASGSDGASGGGSGGAIRIVAGSVSVAGVLSARGGPGGAGGCCGDGGGGGGGRIAILHDQAPSLSGTALVSGGTSGVRSSGGCCVSGVASVDPTGGQGVISLVAGTTFAAPQAATVTYNKSLTLSTTLTQKAGGTPVAGAPVVLSRRATSSAPWTTVATLTTSATGGVSYTAKMTASAEYRWSFAGSSSRQPSTSGVVTVGVAPKVGLKATDKSVPKGDKVVLFGTAKPPAQGTKVVLQRKAGNKWTKVSTAKVKKQKPPGGTKKKICYVFTLPASSTGATTYRVVAPAAGGLAEGVSKSLKIKVV